jgi:hypothetical protein
MATFIDGTEARVGWFNVMCRKPRRQNELITLPRPRLTAVDDGGWELGVEGLGDLPGMLQA